VLPGTFNAYIGTSARHVSTAVSGFLDEIRRIQDERVGAAELRLARDYVVGAFALSFQRASRRATYMINAERYGLPPDNLERFPRQIAGVTAADVALTHPDGGASFSDSLSLGDDMDGGGSPDLLVGWIDDDDGGTGAGAVFLILGEDL